MKRIKSFMFDTEGIVDIEAFDKQVNDFIHALKASGITEIDLKISCTIKFFVYTLIWYDKRGAGCL